MVQVEIKKNYFQRECFSPSTKDRARTWPVDNTPWWTYLSKQAVSWALEEVRNTILSELGGIFLLSKLLSASCSGNILTAPDDALTSSWLKERKTFFKFTTTGNTHCNAQWSLVIWKEYEKSFDVQLTKNSQYILDQSRNKTKIEFD